MLFWLAVSPLPKRLMAQSTPSQCKVVKRAPIPRVDFPRSPPAVGKAVFLSSLSCRRFLSSDQVLETGWEKSDPDHSTPFSNTVRLHRSLIGTQAPGMVSLLVLHQHPVSVLGHKRASGNSLDDASLLDRSDKGVPIETEVRAHAWVVS